MSVQSREAAARKAIRASCGTEDQVYGVTLFVSHHKEELEPDYWVHTFGEADPSPDIILDALILKSAWSDDDLDGTDGTNPDNFDFTLPGDVTDYLICVCFGDGDEIEDISMQS